MSNLIFGRSWEDIQAMQQGTYVAPTVNTRPGLAQATDNDRAQLAEHGQAGLEAKEFYGVLDRLKNSGLI